MKPTTTIVLLTLLALPANAQDGGRIFHDAAGRVTGSARTDANGVTTFHDRAGFVTGTARTDSNDTTTFHDASGRVTGRSGDEGQWLSTNPRSAPRGSANDFSSLAPNGSLVLAGISNFSPMDGCFRRSVRGHAVIVGSRRPEAICVTAEPASVLNRHRC
jgi:hypothetical protein